MVEKNININDDELNKLLRSSFLEEEDSKLIEEQAKFVFNQEYDVKIDQKKEQDFLNKLSGTAGGLGSSLYVIISLLIVAVIGTVFFIFNKPKEKTKTSDKEVKTEVSVAEENVVLSPKQIEEEKKYVQINEEEKKRIEEMAPEMNKELKTILYHSETPPEIPQKEITSNGLKENEYFVLNEKLIVRFKKIKQMMLEKLIKKDKKLYLSIYPGRVNYMGEDMNMTAFYIRNCAITNLEYKTFLIDLLMQGRKSDYDKAKVNSEIWKNYNMPLLAENYFKSEKYNDFPVVNISQEGALMFCNWIQEEVVKYATKTNKKVKGFTIRLPYDIEWMHLADAGFANIPNYDGYMTIFDINEGYIDKSLEKRVQTLKKKLKDNKPENEYYSTNRYEMTEEEVIKIFNKAFTLYDIIPSDTIYPKRMKDFGKFGHVSELILEKKTDEYKIYGSCWKNKNQFLEMMKKYNNSPGSPFVGLRIVMIFDNAEVYKNPFY